MDLIQKLNLNNSEKAIIIIAALIVIALVLIILYRIDNTQEEEPKRNKKKEEEDFDNLVDENEMAEDKIGELFNDEPPKSTPAPIGDIDFGNQDNYVEEPKKEKNEDVSEEDMYKDEFLENPEDEESFAGETESEEPEEKETFTEELPKEKDIKETEEEKKKDLDINIFGSDNEFTGFTENESNEELNIEPNDVKDDLNLFSNNSEIIEDTKEPTEEKSEEERIEELWNSTKKNESDEFSMFTSDSYEEPETKAEEITPKKTTRKTTRKTTKSSSTTKKTTKKKA